MTKGIIALDIDGTITEAFHSVPDEVVAFLGSLEREGWRVVFITGRTYQWGFSILRAMDFPYFFAVQNGAIILEMPMRRIVSKKYLDRSILDAMDEICLGEPTDYVIYAGYEHDDVCYYRPSRFAPPLSEYLKERIKALRETYQAVPSFQGVDIAAFPSVKCFGTRGDAARIAEKMEASLGLHVTPVRDPFDSSYMVAQATHPEATKGGAVREMREHYGEGHIVIAAGNDYNDVSMLAASDIKVVMGNAPADLLEGADVVAPPASEMGIIAGLREAIRIAARRAS